MTMPCTVKRMVNTTSLMMLKKLYHIVAVMSMSILRDFSPVMSIFLCKTVKRCYNTSKIIRGKGSGGGMWKFFGVFVNMATVLAGCVLGMILRRRAAGRDQAPAADKKGLPPRESLPEVMMTCLGFCTVFAAASGLLGLESGVQALIVVASMAGGLLIGWAIRIDDRLNLWGDRLLEKTARGGAGNGGKNPAEGIVTATLLFCVGSMTFLGSFESAANPPGRLDLSCHTTLLIKSMLDFVSSTCLSVSFGLSVMGSVAFILLIQGGLVLLASSLQPFLERIAVMPVMNCVGSLILLGIALNLLGIKKIKTADYLPALLLPVFICWIMT